jgi:hypothetical protein
VIGDDQRAFIDEGAGIAVQFYSEQDFRNATKYRREESGGQRSFCCTHDRPLQAK